VSSSKEMIVDVGSKYTIYFVECHDWFPNIWNGVETLIIGPNILSELVRGAKRMESRNGFLPGVGRRVVLCWSRQYFCVGPALGRWLVTLVPFFRLDPLRVQLGPNQ
jgi:hypothetical protein